MYNFLDPKLLPKVSTTAAPIDGYEATNLLSENPLVKSRGFLAYTSMKPPLDIEFELLCPISIQYISICTTIGTQRTIGIEVQVRNSQPEFISIAHAYYTEDNVVFCNSRYYSKDHPPKLGNHYLGYFKSHLFRLFINAKFVRVRILRTERSTPCLGPVEIWGRVSKSCPKVTAQTIIKLMTKKTIGSPTIPIKKTDINQDFEISEDFKDALTFEVMAIPMTLPSGHSIDQSTLEKCAMNDATYGRKCCDPFTGLHFTENRKPKLNVALKNRIDMFLLCNSHVKETFHISRTVGRKSKCDDNKEKIVDSSYSAVGKKVKFDCNNTRVDNLDDAIAKAMNSSGFVTFTKEAATETSTSNNCGLCQNCDNLYSLPCKHLYCRTCLLDICKIFICKKCNTQFCRDSVQKLYL